MSESVSDLLNKFCTLSSPFSVPDNCSPVFAADQYGTSAVPPQAYQASIAYRDVSLPPAVNYEGDKI